MILSTVILGYVSMSLVVFNKRCVVVVTHLRLIWYGPSYRYSVGELQDATPCEDHDDSDPNPIKVPWTSREPGHPSEELGEILATCETRRHAWNSNSLCICANILRCRRLHLDILWIHIIVDMATTGRFGQNAYQQQYDCGWGHKLGS